MEVKKTYTVNVKLAKKIIDDYHSGLTMRSISKKHNILYNRVIGVLKTNNVEKRRASDNNRLIDYKKSCKPHFLDGEPEVYDELKRLYSEGYSLTDIGNHFNVSHATARNWLMKLGVKLRSLAESNNMDKLKDKKKSAMQNKYGVDNPMQLIDVHHKAMKSGYRLRDVVIKGRTFSVQGFEPQALEHLVKEGMDVNSISVGVNVPTISYRFKGKDKKYFPDFYHKDSNTIYEVKSVYTYKANKYMNQKKAQATADAGYNHITLIFENKGICPIDTIVTQKD
jgi:transposase-like protein